jgi:hypothetical protein
LLAINFMSKLIRSFYTNNIRILAVIAIVMIVQILELLLLERKYDLFTGGFLQPYSYISFDERFWYLAISTWIDLFFFGVIGYVWFRLSDRAGIRYLVSVYNYFFISTSLMAVWLAIKYKVLSYFNDTLNFVIIRNLGGGSLSEALVYVAQEGALIAILLLAAFVSYLLGLRFVKQAASHAMESSQVTRGKGGWLYVLAAFLGTTVLVYYINTEESLRYGMHKKTSFYLLGTILDPLSDLDRDGYGQMSHPIDPAPLDGHIYPGALDVPGNGVDEDGIGGDFILPGDDRDPLELLLPRPGQHILLVVLESARGDLVGKRLHGEPIAPNMMDIADAGTAIPYAYTHTGYTTSSIKAIFNRTLSDRNDRVTTTDFLKRSGYGLSFLSGQDESFGSVASSVGMDADDVYLFDARSAIEDRVFPSTEPGSLRLSEERMVQEFISRSDSLDWSDPQFIYVNLQAAHFPYNHPTMPALVNNNPIPRNEISAENREWLDATYWNAIANADWAIGEMVKQLRTLGVYEDTLVLILGDHGESLFDDNYLGHGHALNKTQSHIPLIINRPGLDVPQAVGQLDVAELMISLGTGQFSPGNWQDREQGVFQVVGSLRRPQLVGTVRSGEIRTTLDLRTRKIFFSNPGGWVNVDVALKDPDLKLRAAELLQQWEILRWRNHIAKQEKPAVQ